MGSWKDFIAEVPIVNKRSEGIFVKADHVLDLWEERNQLRAEVARLRGTPDAGNLPVAAVEVPVAEGALPVAVGTPLDAQVREQCAREAEAFAQAWSGDPEFRPFVQDLFRAFAEQLRPRDDQEAADFLSHVEIPPAAVPVAEVPAAEPVEAWIPTAEPVAEAEPQEGPFDFGRPSGH